MVEASQMCARTLWFGSSTMKQFVYNLTVSTLYQGVPGVTSPEASSFASTVCVPRSNMVDERKKRSLAVQT